MYIKAINKEAFENGLLPRGFKAEFCSYFTYFDFSQNHNAYPAGYATDDR